MIIQPKEKPPFLYKYHSAERVTQIVNDLTLYLAPAAGQNDLYEFRARSLYEGTEQSKRKIYAKCLVKSGFFSTFEESFRSTKDLDFDDRDAFYDAAIDYLNRSLDNIMKNSGVTCFGADRNNQRMWGTYGDNHAGAVIEFTTDETKSVIANHFGPVIYANEHPRLCPSDFFKDDMSLETNFIHVALHFKHMDWRDEREWRLLMLADEEQGPQDRVFKFERDAITRIYLGPRITDENEEKIRAAAARHTPEIPIWKRRPDDFLAAETLHGFEEIRDFDSLLYWYPNLDPGRK